MWQVLWTTVHIKYKPARYRIGKFNPATLYIFLITFLPNFITKHHIRVIMQVGLLLFNRARKRGHYTGKGKKCLKHVQSTACVLSLIALSLYFWFKYNLGEKFDPTRVRIHNLQIMTVHFMSLRCLL